jgi:hypothetical protein
MKAMQPASARALTVTAALVVLVGFVVMSPSAAFLAFWFAAILAAFPAVFGAGKMRLIAAVLLLGSMGLAMGKYPEFREELSRYRQHTHSP